MIQVRPGLIFNNQAKNALTPRDAHRKHKMTELLANWTKVVVGVCAVIVTIGWVTGRVSTNDFLAVLGATVGIHGISSGGSALLGGNGQKQNGPNQGG